MQLFMVSDTKGSCSIECWFSIQCLSASDNAASSTYALENLAAENLKTFTSWYELISWWAENLREITWVWCSISGGDWDNWWWRSNESSKVTWQCALHSGLLLCLREGTMVDKNGRALADLCEQKGNLLLMIASEWYDAGCWAPCITTGNDECADCGMKPPEWASYNLGIFLCTRWNISQLLSILHTMIHNCFRCAACHRSMGAHISKIKHLKLDQWEDSQVARMKEVSLNLKVLRTMNKSFRFKIDLIWAHWHVQVGNINAKLKYEQWVPPSYRKVDSSTPQVLLPSSGFAFQYCDIHGFYLFQTLVEQWIFAKYGREEFIHPERQSYTSGFMEVFT